MILLSPAFLCLPRSRRRMVWTLGQFLQDQAEKHLQGNSSNTLWTREVHPEMLLVSLKGTLNSIGPALQQASMKTVVRALKCP